MNSSILAFNEKIDISCPVKLWSEIDGLSFYSKSSAFYKRKARNIKELQDEIKLFVLHHSVTYTASETFNVLNSRKLSVNFIIDDDCNDNGYATIYQCLDLKDVGQSQGKYNFWGPGVEISYHPEAWKNDQLYSEDIRKNKSLSEHPICEDIIHGQKFKVFGPSEAQVKSTIALATGLCQLFPKIKPEFPRFNQEVAKTEVAEDKLTGFACHYHLTKNKIDPAGFPLQQMETEVKNRLVWGY